MSSGGIGAKVRVSLIVEIDAGEWGDDATVAQVRKQTHDAAEGVVRRLPKILTDAMKESRVEGVRVVGCTIDETYDVKLREPTR